MNVQQAELYKRILEFPLDAKNSPFSFSQRLAKDNGWTSQYTQCVINEYKKFVFLAVVAGHPVAPSDQVDQVWHLHLTYTESYWNEFCAEILHAPLHHNPTRGGSKEHYKFNDWYINTLASYERFFGQTPPTNIWSPPHIRFGRDIHFVRVNTQQNWILPKPFLKLPKIDIRRSVQKLSPILLLLFSLIFTLTNSQRLLASDTNSQNSNTSEFPWFYFFMGFAILIGVLSALGGGGSGGGDGGWGGGGGGSGSGGGCGGGSSSSGDCGDGGDGGGDGGGGCGGGGCGGCGGCGCGC